ncbi:hypothetical protein B566_EDAN007008, partial [Ephemera danica]
MSDQDCIEMRRTFLAPAPTPGLLGGDPVPQPTRATSSLITDQSQCSRNVTLGRELGRSPTAAVTSPGFPQPYPDNARCLTRVRAPAGYHVVIEFEELVLEKEP